MQECEKRELQLPEKHFELSYETNIPRQAGLSGSSAIACAALNCLLMHYDVADRCGIPLFGPHNTQHWACSVSNFDVFPCTDMMQWHHANHM